MCFSSAISVLAESFTTNIISGISTNLSGPYTIGDFGSFNYLEINSGGSLVDTAGIIGSNVAATANTVLVTGSNSVWKNQGSLYLGVSGSDNRLSIVDGGQVIVSNASASYVGLNVSSSNNSVVVAGSNSVWFTSADCIDVHCELSVGYSGSGNQVALSDGGRVVSTYGSVGVFSSNNLVLVTGAGSVWQVADGLYIGGNSSANQLIITNSG